MIVAVKDIHGVILIDKPAGWTSFDVVAKIRNIARAASSNKKIKVGHSGTLDPFATGLLIVLIGAATKHQDEFMKKDKWYDVEMVLGSVSSTGDPEGDITEVNGQAPNQEAIQETLQKFTGQIQQVPPAFSAIKVDGRRAYDLARAGKEVKLEPRAVTIREIKNVKFGYPKLSFSAHVSSGTYIRSLVTDIGETLKVGAYTSALRRMSIDTYDVSQAIDLKDVTPENISSLIKPL